MLTDSLGKRWSGYAFWKCPRSPITPFCGQLSWNGPSGINPERAVNKDGCVILLSLILRQSSFPCLRPRLCLPASGFTPSAAVGSRVAPRIFILDNNVCYQNNWIQRWQKGCRTVYNTCCEKGKNQGFAWWHLVQGTQFIRAVSIYLSFSDSVLGENSLRHKMQRALLAKPVGLIQTLNIFRRVKHSRPLCFVLWVKLAKIKKEIISSPNLGYTSTWKGSEVPILWETDVPALGLWEKNVKCG